MRAMVQDAAQGTPRAQDYGTDFWKAEVLPNQKRVQSEMKDLGEVVCMTPVDCGDANGLRSYRYRLEFANAILLMRYVLDAQNKVTASEWEAFELKPTWRFGGPPKTVVDLGVALGIDRQSIVVIGLLPDSPAMQKDVHVGDRLLAVAQGTEPALPVRSENLARAVELIRGPAGTTVRLTMVPAGKDPSHTRVVSLERPELD